MRRFGGSWLMYGWVYRRVFLKKFIFEVGGNTKILKGESKLKKVVFGEDFYGSVFLV